MVEARIFQLMAEQVQDYAVFLLDTEGYILSWSQGAQRLKGYRSEEIIGKHFSIFYPDEAKRIAQIKQVQAERAAPGRTLNTVERSGSAG